MKPNQKTRAAVLALALSASPLAAQEFYIGTVQSFAFGYCPSGWIPADGSILRIQDHQALYVLLGNAYGGDNAKTFAIPDLRGAAPAGAGTGLDRPRLGRGESRRFAAGSSEDAQIDMVGVHYCIAAQGLFPSRN